MKKIFLTANMFIFVGFLGCGNGEVDPSDKFKPNVSAKRAGSDECTDSFFEHYLDLERKTEVVSKLGNLAYALEVARSDKEAFSVQRLQKIREETDEIESWWIPRLEQFRSFFSGSYGRSQTCNRNGVVYHSQNPINNADSALRRAPEYIKSINEQINERLSNIAASADNSDESKKAKTQAEKD